MTIAVISSDQTSAWIAASTKTMQRAGQFARESMASDRTDDALRHCAAALGELRSVLLPPAYWELWSIATSELAVLEAYFTRILSKEASEYDHVSLYNKVQSAGNVLPRLYLLFTVGSATLKHLAAYADQSTEEKHDAVVDALPISALPITAPALLADMEALCKGVQHPVRGLFLRAYLLQSVKSALRLNPEDSIEFLLENFVEMLKLWCRMNYADEDTDVLSYSTMSTRTHREQMADLVGKNLLYLAELVSLEAFVENVCGRILEQVVLCRDTIAQTYLMECITAVFPDEFQIATMDQLLGVLPKLDASVEMGAVLGSMLDRLAKYAQADPAAFESLDGMRAFDTIAAAVDSAVSAHKDWMSGSSIVSMYGGLLAFADAVYPGRVAYVDEVLGKCVAHFQTSREEKGATDEDAKDEKRDERVPHRKLVELLCIPLETYDLTTVLSIQQFLALVDVLSDAKKKELAFKVATMVPQRDEVVLDATSARALVCILEALYGRDADEDDARAFSKALDSIRVEDAVEHVKLLEDIVEGLKGRDDLVRCVGPAVVSSALDAIDRADGIDGGHPQIDKILIFTVGVCTRIADAGSGSQAVDLLLRVVAASVARDGDGDGFNPPNVSNTSSVVYECMEQACRLFEENVYESTACKAALASLVDVLPTVDAVLLDESRDMLHHKIGSYCTKLLSRKDQCEMLVSLARVELDGPSILSRLQRAERVVSAIQEQDAVFASIRTPEEIAVSKGLIKEVLDAYVLHKERGIAGVTDDDIHRLKMMYT